MGVSLKKARKRTSKPIQVTSGPLKVLFIGTDSAYCRNALKAISRRHHVAGIVCSQTKGGGQPQVLLKKVRNLLKFSLESWAGKRGVPFYRLTDGNIDGLPVFIKGTKTDIGCIISMPQVLPAKFFRIPRLGMIAMHPSLLPKYRGPNPFFWQYFHMENKGGVTVFFMDEHVETGDILAQASFPIEFGMEPGKFVAQAGELGVKLLIKTLDEIAAGRTRARVQRHIHGEPFARKVYAGESLINCHKWPIERVFHVLKGSAFADIFMPRPVSFIDWKPSSFEKGGKNAVPGVIKFGIKGFYIPLPEGRIYLAPDISPTGLLKAVSRILGRQKRRGVINCREITTKQILQGSVK